MMSVLKPVLCVTVHSGVHTGNLFHAAGKFCKNQLTAFVLSASISHAHQHIFLFQKALLKLTECCHVLINF